MAISALNMLSQNVENSQEIFNEKKNTELFDEELAGLLLANQNQMIPQFQDHFDKSTLGDEALKVEENVTVEENNFGNQVNFAGPKSQNLIDNKNWENGGEFNESSNLSENSELSELVDQFQSLNRMPELKNFEETENSQNLLNSLKEQNTQFDVQNVEKDQFNSMEFQRSELNDQALAIHNNAALSTNSLNSMNSEILNQDSIQLSQFDKKDLILNDKEHDQVSLNREETNSKPITLGKLFGNQISGNEFMQMKKALDSKQKSLNSINNENKILSNNFDSISNQNVNQEFLQSLNVESQNKNFLNGKEQSLEDDLKTHPNIKDKKTSNLIVNGGEPIQVKNSTEVVAHVTTGGMMKERISTSGLQEISNGIQTISQKGGGEMKIRLNPGDLGELVLKIKTNGSQVGIQIQASNEKSKKILEESIHSLKESLSSQNLALNQMEFTVKPNPTFDSNLAQNQNFANQNESFNQGNQFGNQNENFRNAENLDHKIQAQRQLKKMILTPQPMTSSSSQLGRLNITA